MKQGRSIAAALSDASALITERSPQKTVQSPSLTIMTPHRVGTPDQNDDPPMSVKLYGSEVRALYEFLHRYYEEK